MRAASLFLAFALAACSKDKASPAVQKSDEIPKLTMDQVDREIAAHTMVAVDCNGNVTREKYGTLPQAIRIDDGETYAADVLPANKAARLVFYCWNPG